MKCMGVVVVRASPDGRVGGQRAGRRPSNAIPIWSSKFPKHLIKHLMCDTRARRYVVNSGRPATRNRAAVAARTTHARLAPLDELRDREYDPVASRRCHTHAHMHQAAAHAARTHAHTHAPSSSSRSSHSRMHQAAAHAAPRPLSSCHGRVAVHPSSRVALRTSSRVAIQQLTQTHASAAPHSRAGSARTALSAPGAPHPSTHASPTGRKEASSVRSPAAPVSSA